MALLEIAGLVFRLPARPLLDGVDLSLPAGEIHALVGTNGTGKSALAYLIMGCEGYRLDQGEIRFDGHRIDGLPLFERARLGISLAWQEPARFEGLLVRDYLSLGRNKADVEDCLQRVGLSPADYVNRKVDKTLSGGERKRIELASVLSLAPRLVILDEPTAGIDLLSIREIIKLIGNFKQRGSAVLLITHREEVTRIADRASQLCGGRIVCSGDPESVAASYQGRACRRCDGRECHDG
ncbi:MAG: ATP-binding cassette domain-containing protein [Candidatus Accumulibacter sp.]|uniref:ATP-binding cassette domain-containing protein n=1 Tax=Accumulibacter sp. TaxID=2053492 RepID=UPI001DC67BFD|nr:ATP-binding cassette domain-containing protein [Accumulibacter sp.]MCB1942276.1 ATP-binding cassette domain-containing protein [Accumulibacter sp.]MCP5249880.1 ATP-binding cassette domain-containing protein [Accumulibacter sp.]